MATNASPFVVNIVDLQNIATGISGTSKDSLLAQAQTDIANLQQIVDFQTRTVSADVIKSFTEGGTIDVMASLNLSNASLYSNSNIVSLNTTTPSNVNVSRLGNATDTISVDTLGHTLTFTTAGTQAFQIDSNGSASFSGNVHVDGTLYVNTLVQTSDKEMKSDIVPFFTSIDDVLKLESRRFTWTTSGRSDIGFIAQDVQAIWPDLTDVSPNGTLGIAYSRFIPLLLESIRELNDRVLRLEAASRDGLRNTEPKLSNGSTSGNEPVYEPTFKSL